MVKIKWHIAEDISKITVDHFDNELNDLVDGHFELSINQSKAGCYIPEWIENDFTYGRDDPLYWLRKMLEGIIEIQNGGTYVFQLYSANLRKIALKLDEQILVSYIDTEIGLPEWEERTNKLELEKEIALNVKSLIDYIGKENASLLNSKWISLLEKNLLILNKIIMADEMRL